MKNKIIIICLFPCIAYSACFKNDYLDIIDYWYYHVDGHRKCIEKLQIKPSDSICSTENDRELHFIKKNTVDSEWRYYNYQDKVEDKIIFKDNIMEVNHAIIDGKKTRINLSESKEIVSCKEPPVIINENICTTDDINLILKKQIIIAVMNYVFSEYEKKDLFYQEISIDSKIIDLAFELQRMKIERKQKSISYRFNNFKECSDYFVVNLISYSAPLASSEKVFIIKIIDNKLEIIKEDMLWIS